MKFRTFIALELPEAQKAAIREYLNIWRRAHPNGINWVKDDNLHLTLLFIGDTQSADIPELDKELFDLCRKVNSFELRCMGFELFPAIEPRLLWVKLEASDKAIFSFAKDLSKAVREFGYEPDAKALKLHITVGRIKIQQPVWAEQEFLKSELPGDMAVFDNVTLYQSMLYPDGPVYTPLAQYQLKMSK